MYKIFCRLQGPEKDRIGYSDALAFAKLFIECFNLIKQKKNAKNFMQKTVDLCVDVQDVIWRKYEYETLRRMVS